MVQTEYGGQGGVKKATRRNWQRILLPIVGLFLMFAAGLVAYFISQPVANFIGPKILNVAGSTPGIRAAAGIGIFLIILMIFAAIYAAIAPKPPKGITEGELDKEKKERLQEEMAKKKRQRDMKNKMRQSRKNQQ